MKNVRLFAVAAALGMFASTVAAAETTTKSVEWTGADPVIKVDLGEKLIVSTPTATVKLDATTTECQNGTDSNKDGYVDGEIFAVNPTINAEQGWLYTNAKYWVTNKTESKTAMYYLGLGGGSITGGRFLAPNAEENKGTFTEQLTHKNYTEAELVTLYTEAGLYRELRDEDDNIVAIEVYPQNIYADAKQEIKLGTLVKRFSVESQRTVAVEEVQKAALVYLANGTIEEGSKYFNTSDILYPTNAYYSTDAVHLINNGTYGYAYTGNDEKDYWIGTGTVGGLLVETGKRDSSRVTYDTFKYDLNGDNDYDDAGEVVTGPTLTWYADSKVTLSHGAQATKLADNTDYIVCDAAHDGSNEADHDGQLYLSAGSFKFVEYVGEAIDKETIKGINTAKAADVTGIEVRGAYQTVDAIYVTNASGVSTKYEASDLFTNAYVAYESDDVETMLTAVDGATPYVINPLDDSHTLTLDRIDNHTYAIGVYLLDGTLSFVDVTTANEGLNPFEDYSEIVTAVNNTDYNTTSTVGFYHDLGVAANEALYVLRAGATKLIKIPATDTVEVEGGDTVYKLTTAATTVAAMEGALVYAAKDGEAWDIEDSAHNKYVLATDAMMTNAVTGIDGTKPATIKYIESISARGYATVKNVPTLYDNTQAEEVWGLDILATKTGEQVNADGVYYAKINGVNTAVYETNDAAVVGIDNTNNLDSYEADYYSEHDWDKSSFAAAYDDAKAADATHVMVTDKFGEVEFIPVANLYAVGKEGTRKVSPIANLLKSDKIVVINVDDEENPYRLASVTPADYKANDAAGYYRWNEEDSTFDFIPDAIEVDSYADLVGAASTKFGKTTNIAGTTITATDFEKVFAKSFEIKHQKGIYYLETPANESDLYVLYTGDTSDLDIDYSVNTAKGEAYVEVAGKTVTTKAAQLEDRGWYPAFETEEELVKFVYAITGIDTALVGDKDTTGSTFKAWYDAAAADLQAEIGSLPTGEVLPTTAVQPDHKKKACEYTATSTVDGSKVSITSNAAEINTSEAGVYDLVWTASYDGEELEDTHTVKVVVAPNYTRTWENGKVKTLVSYYVNNPTAKYAEYNYDWANKTATVTYYNVDGSVNDTATISL